MTMRILLLIALVASPMFAQVAQPLPPRPLPGGPLGLRPVETPPVAPIEPNAEAGPTLLPANLDDGYFVESEVALVFPTLQNQLPAKALLRVPQVGLDTTYSAGFEVGYRLFDAQGSFTVGYHFLNADGTGDVNLNAIGYSVRTRAALNVLDLDYGSTPYEFAPRYTIAYRVGARFAHLFFDSRGTADRDTPPNHIGNVLQGFGSGAHGRLDLERRIALVSGLSLFGRVEGAAMVGTMRQRFRQVGQGITSTLSDDETRTMPVLAGQVGLNYTPPSIPRLKISAGYTYEEWFKTGSLGLNAGGTIAGSQGNLRWHGPFLRGQLDF
ncbi:MAG: hypothetical protein EBV06_16405 [Planctomycetia bacterium]|nr:hypothetical protein [Planctomycetia bacterium]